MATFDELIVWDSQVHGVVNSFEDAFSFVETLYNTPFKTSQRLEHFIQALNQTDSLKKMLQKSKKRKRTLVFCYITE